MILYKQTQRECPKCEHAGGSIRHHKGWATCLFDTKARGLVGGEHLHVKCAQCGYEWGELVEAHGGVAQDSGRGVDGGREEREERGEIGETGERGGGGTYEHITTEEVHGASEYGLMFHQREDAMGRVMAGQEGKDGSPNEPGSTQGLGDEARRVLKDTHTTNIGEQVND